ncbi:MAG TPA: efflux RND transporter periplasmic adaptor subunit [Chitinispirillaceae bacterium]|nr:efflux RND transporter periplasmic adaptor subunit [Chitinispirillaceae bacterium]
MASALTTDSDSTQLQSLRLLQQIRNFEGESAAFWQLFLDILIRVSRAEAAIISLRTGEDASQSRILAMGPQNSSTIGYCKELSAVIPKVSDACMKNGYAFLPCDQYSLIAVNLIIDLNTQKCMAILRLPFTDKNEVTLAINELLSVSDIPAQYRLQQSALSAMKNQGRLTDILDLMALLNSQNRFIACAMTVCNELAARFTCDRVSLGWYKKGYVRVKAMSHTDQFEKKMEAVQHLELAMEEAFDQDADIIFPAPQNSTCIYRDHEVYSKEQDSPFIATLPLRKNGQTVALCTLERSKEPFEKLHLQQLRVVLDQLTTRLDELYTRDRWFGARLANWIRVKLSRILGYDHTWTKLLCLLGSVALMLISFVPIRYRVDAPMILRTDDVSYITAPFDGYIQNVNIKPGELVKTNQILLSIDKKDLLLEEASLLAEKNREEREVEKARASGELADMCISQARYDQSYAKLSIVRYRLNQADILAPYDGVLIEGDQQEKIGAPVKQGEILFKTGRIKDIYSEAKVSELEIQNIKNGAQGEIALAGKPQKPFKISVSLIVPSAVVNDKDNVFLVRCKFTEPVPEWFRPGMTGVSKINAGKKTILWIICHRTVDFLRLKLWW